MHNVTFHQLHGATGIELNVVAADLSLRRQIIFSHIETPNCVVADAVVASSSIPFAFPSRLLQVREGNNGRIYHHTVVDLPTFLKGDAWPARTVIALILVFSFAAATMINVEDKALTALKDVTLIVVGFYFGAAKAAGREKEKTDETRGNAHPKEKKPPDSVTPNTPHAGQPEVF